MATKWTKEQLLAIETRGQNLLVAAAAGSGKTAVLVERIIKMITDDKNPVDIDKLLVVTFTNAAASEMRERIGDAISKRLEETPDSKVLQRQLALLNKSNITTIHSFCLDVIKNNFHLIDLDPGFRIGDETECNLIKQDILVELFDDKYDEEDKGFLNLVEAYCSNRDDEKLKDIILKLYNFSMSGPWPEKWLREKAYDFKLDSLEDLEKTAWYKVLKESLYLEFNNSKENLQEAIEVCEEDCDLAPYLLTLEPELNRVVNIINSLDLGLDKIYEAVSYVKFDRIKAPKKGIGDELDREKIKSLRDKAKDRVNKIREEVFSVPLEEAIDGIKKMYPIITSLTELVIEFSKRYSDKKREKTILDFNDLEHLCLKILTSYDEGGQIEASMVAKKFREKFDEVLVDEYQDSNNVQETIINMVSRKTLDNPNVFMVGDVKQSIYRFRQAKPELFLDKYNSYSMDDKDKNRKIMLYKNFRSREEVINGVNFVFKSLMSETVGELDYTLDEALNLGASYEDISKENIFLNPQEEIDIENIDVAGDIELHILDKSGDFEEEQKSENSTDEENLKEEEEDLTAVAIEARIIEKRIKELMNPSNGKAFMVFDKDLNKYRKIRYKDIVILLRATKNWADTIVEELSFGGIPVYADTSAGYFQTIEIRTIMAVLHIIDNPMQDIYTIASMRSPIFSFTSEELADIRLLNRESYFYLNVKDIADGVYDKTIDKDLKEKCLYFIEKINGWREISLYMPIDEFIWYLYSDTAYYGYVGAMVNGVQRQANLRILFQRAKQYEQTSFKGLFNFINFINRLKKSSGDLGTAKILGENEDVVRIMSIHKSKGLEFPVVFLSGCGKQFNLMDSKDSLLFHEELGIGADCIDIEKRIKYKTLQKYAIKKKFELETLSEEMRILYVALTRAKEKLIITGASSNLQKDIEACYKAGEKGLDKVMPSEVLKQKSYLKWIMTALVKHKDGEILRQGKNEFIKILDDLSTWQIDFHRKNEFFVDNTKDSVDKEKNTILSLDYDNFVIDEEVKRRLDFKYKYNEVCTVPSNISVSDIKKAEEEVFTFETENFFKEENIRKKPKFITEEKGLSKAEKGTAMHFVMQKLDLDKINSVNEIKEQVKAMFEKELITEDEEKAINSFKIQKFFKSNLGERMIKAYKENREVYRELPFITDIPVKRIEKELVDKIFDNEKLRLQGIIDCFFEEEDGIVLLDYKTDYVEDGKEEELLDRYKVQIDLYTETLEKIVGKKVKERYLYLFGIDKEVKYKN